MFSGVSTLPKHEIVDCGAFYEPLFSASRPGIRLGDFFYSLNNRNNPRKQPPALKPPTLVRVGFIDLGWTYHTCFYEAFP
jgi:hypothetical protein